MCSEQKTICLTQTEAEALCDAIIDLVQNDYSGNAISMFFAWADGLLDDSEVAYQGFAQVYSSENKGYLLRERLRASGVETARVEMILRHLEGILLEPRLQSLREFVGRYEAMILSYQQKLRDLVESAIDPEEKKREINSIRNEYNKQTKKYLQDGGGNEERRVLKERVISAFVGETPDNR